MVLSFINFHFTISFCKWSNFLVFRCSLVWRIGVILRCSDKFKIKNETTVYLMKTILKLSRTNNVSSFIYCMHINANPPVSSTPLKGLLISNFSYSPPICRSAALFFLQTYDIYSTGSMEKRSWIPHSKPIHRILWIINFH